MLHLWLYKVSDFNPQGSREPRPNSSTIVCGVPIFQSTRLSRASTAVNEMIQTVFGISIHKALASLDHFVSHLMWRIWSFQSTRLSRASTLFQASSSALPLYFNPQGSREPRLLARPACKVGARISIHKALASLDVKGFALGAGAEDFNPQGSREPRLISFPELDIFIDFNPQGSREPRRNIYYM